MFKEDHLSFRQRKYMKVKNIIGRALGGIGLVVLSPVYLAIIVAIKKEDGITAPVFFSQKRVGIHKEYFNLYKFRSMRTDTPHDKPTHLLENPDQYITKVGHFLRKSSLDELPQLWNIARGDMAVIGPRPALWNQDDLIAERDKYGANYRENGMPDIQAGDVTLTGSQALAHARNRTLGNDFERTRRQRSVMYGIYRKIMEKKDPSALLPLINYAVNHVRTNMSVSEMYSMAKDVLSVDDLKMQQTCIPQDGTYTDITYEGMQVLKVDFDANKKKIEQLLY